MSDLAAREPRNSSEIVKIGFAKLQHSKNDKKYLKARAKDPARIQSNIKDYKK